MRYGIIIVPVTDMRAEPDWRSERRSQALFGAPVAIDDVRDEYSHIVLSDGYSGWCRNGHLDRIPHADWKRYLVQPKQMIKSSSAPVGGRQYPKSPFVLYFSTEVVITRRSGKNLLTLPNGYSATIESRHLTVASKGLPDHLIGRKVVATARRFLGTPYLWGGLTPCGFDCSGLVQAVYRFYGVRLPRDSKDQRRIGKPVERAKLLPGDLLFFPGHVAISCGGADIIHASSGRGMVTIDSLDPQAANYRKDLDKSFAEARRVLP